MYKCVGGSIFYRNKQILVVVPVSGSPRMRDKVVETLIEVLNKEKTSGRKPKAGSAGRKPSRSSDSD